MRRKLYYIGVYFALIIGITGCGIAQAQGNIDVIEKNETTITKTEIEEINDGQMKYKVRKSYGIQSLQLEI